MLVAIKLQTRSAIECLFVGVDYEVPVSIFLLQLKLIEWDRDVLFACSQKSTDTNNGSINFAAFLQDEVFYVANFVVIRIVDVLFVVVAHWESALNLRKHLVWLVGPLHGRSLVGRLRSILGGYCRARSQQSSKQKCVFIVASLR